jgi:branched-chain amino acid transport system substrate-binding protein
MISPSNTAPILTDPAAREPGYFRTAHNDEIQGRAMAAFAYNELGARTAAAIHDGGPYTEGLASVFADAFEDLGGHVVAFEEEDPNAMDVTQTLQGIAAAGPPDFLYYPVFVILGGSITQQARAMHALENTTLAGADGMLSSDFLHAAGDAARGMYLSGPDLRFENEAYDTFLEKYRERYGEVLNVFHAHAYDATTMLLEAIDEVAIAGRGGRLLIPRQTLRDAVAAMEGHQGLTGTHTCDANGDCSDPKIAVREVQKGSDELQFVPIWEYEP